jgi:hypothetical protein
MRRRYLIDALLALALLLLLATPAPAEPAGHRLTWWIVAHLPSGVRLLRSPEEFLFPDLPACEAFADAHLARVEDWTRGYLRAPWELPVTVGFECKAEEKPA